MLSGGQPVNLNRVRCDGLNQVHRGTLSCGFLLHYVGEAIGDAEVKRMADLCPASRGHHRTS